MNDLAKYKTFWNRLLAGFIDSMLFMPLMIIDFFINHMDNIAFFLSWHMIGIISWMAYLVIGHGKYGQTLGKKLMKIKVLDISEQGTIGYARAFFRESIWLIAEFAAIAYLFYLSANTAATDEQILKIVYEDYMAYTTLAWFLLELVTMLLNRKRRALHDYIAGSVVIKIDRQPG